VENALRGDGEALSLANWNSEMAPRPPLAEAHWYAAYIAPCREKRVAEQFTQRQIEFPVILMLLAGSLFGNSSALRAMPNIRVLVVDDSSPMRLRGKNCVREKSEGSTVREAITHVDHSANGAED